MPEEQRQSLKLWKSGSFDACKNAAAPMIVMLGCSELDMEVLDIGMETMESGLCIVLGTTLSFSEGFSEVAAGVSAVAEALWPLEQESSL